jgi:DNA replication and repair protein RecF
VTAAFVRRLTLSNFRSYAAAGVAPARRLVVLTGPNGAGKTNVLEALSFLAPGRGLRRATLDEVAREDGAGGWAIAADIEGALGLARLGTGFEPAPGDDARDTRRCRIDGEPVGSAAAFADHLAVVWLTPAQDGLFAGPASERRRFLDRLVLAVDAEHGSRVNALERQLRARNKLLEAPSPDTAFVAAVERAVAEVAVAVAAARVETVARLTDRIATTRDDGSPFPFALVAIEGVLEQALVTQSALAVEDGYRARLAAARPRDAAAGRTLEGPHLSDLLVRHGPKGMAADRASTGEQKALLIGLVLAHVDLVTRMTGTAPLVLLDEVAAHFDPVRRRALFERLEAQGTQCWMTGADASAFADLEGRADLFEVVPGVVTRRA